MRRRARVIRQHRAGVRVQVAAPDLAGGLEPDGLGVIEKPDVREGQLVGFEFLVGGLAQLDGQAGVVEGRRPLAFGRIHDDKFFAPPREVVAVPEPGVVLEPVRPDFVFVGGGAGAKGQQAGQRDQQKAGGEQLHRGTNHKGNRSGS